MRGGRGLRPQVSVRRLAHQWKQSGGGGGARLGNDIHEILEMAKVPPALYRTPPLVSTINEGKEWND